MPEDLDKLREANKRIKDLTAQIPLAFDAEKKRIEEATRVRVEEGRAKLQEEWNHMPKPLGMEIDIEFTPDGKPVMESLRRRISWWNDGYGNEIFTGPEVAFDQIQELSRQVSGQKDAFAALSDEEKAKIQGNFDSSEGKSPNSKPYADYLRSEALGRRFRELKENPPMPFGTKKT